MTLLDDEIISMRRASGENLIRYEIEQGHEIVSPQWWGEDWTHRTIISQDGDRIRLIALEAKNPHGGAFTRLIENILRRRLFPVVVEPNELLESWCIRHGWRGRMIGHGKYRHWVYHPRRGR